MSKIRWPWQERTPADHRLWLLKKAHKQELKAVTSGYSDLCLNKAATYRKLATGLTPTQLAAAVDLYEALKDTGEE